MRRAGLGLFTYFEFFLLAVLMAPLFALSALKNGDRDPSMRHRGRWMRRFGKLTGWITPLWRFSVKGEAPKDILERGYVVVSNHESTADLFLLSWLPWDMRWIGKQELWKLPLLGWLLRWSGDIPVRRGDKESVVRMFSEARTTLAYGCPVMMFPEGTRSKDGNLLPFKDGAFELAIEAQVPVLPVVVRGTRDCRPKGSIWFGDAEADVTVLEPIPTAGLTMSDVPRLREQVREVIQRAKDGMAVRVAA